VTAATFIAWRIGVSSAMGALAISEHSSFWRCSERAFRPPARNTSTDRVNIQLPGKMCDVSKVLSESAHAERMVVLPADRQRCSTQFERLLLADRGFSRMSAAWQSSSNDRSAAVRSAKWLAAVDPQPSLGFQTGWSQSSRSRSVRAEQDACGLRVTTRRNTDFSAASAGTGWWSASVSMRCTEA